MSENILESLSHPHRRSPTLNKLKAVAGHKSIHLSSLSPPHTLPHTHTRTVGTCNASGHGTWSHKPMKTPLILYFCSIIPWSNPIIPVALSQIINILPQGTVTLAYHTWVSISSYPCQHLVIPNFLIFVNLQSVKWQIIRKDIFLCIG